MINKDKKLTSAWQWHHKLKHHTHRLVILPARNRYARLYHQRTWTLVVDFATIVTIMIMLAVIIFFWNHPLTSNRHIDLSVEPVGTIVSGQVNHWQLNLGNNNRSDLQQAYLSWHLPAGWQIVDLHNDEYHWDPDQNILFINTLPANSELVIDFTTAGWGDVIYGNDWQVQFFYLNLGIKHNKTLAMDTVYDGSSLNLQISAPDQIYIANPVALDYTLLNNSNLSVESRVVLLVPGDFTVNGYKTENNNYQWERFVAAGDSWQRQLLGGLYSWSGDKALLTWFWQVKQGEEWLDQGKMSYSLPVIKPQIDLDLSLDNESDYKLHTDYRADVYIHNRQAQPLYNVRWQLEAIDQLWQLTQQWSTQSLKSLSFGEEDFLTVDWRVISSQQEQWAELPLRVRLSWTDDPTSTMRYYVYSEIKNLSFSPSLLLSSQIYYFTPAGDQIGYGPLPPRVNWATSYWLSLSLFSDWGGFSNSAAIITLAPGVRLLDYNSSHGVVYMDGDIRWAPGDYSYQSDSIPRLNLQLEIKPTAKQVGQRVELLQSVIAHAISDLTEQEFTATTAGLDNNMSGDRQGPNDGLVRP